MEIPEMLEELKESNPQKYKEIIEVLESYYERFSKYVWVDKDTMLYIDGSKTAYRCEECGSNVFKRSATGDHAKCNGCHAVYEIEK